VLNISCFPLSPKGRRGGLSLYLIVTWTFSFKTHRLLENHYWNWLQCSWKTSGHRVQVAQTADIFRATTPKTSFSISNRYKNKLCRIWEHNLQDKISGISHFNFLRNTADFFFYLLTSKFGSHFLFSHTCSSKFLFEHNSIST